MTRRDRCILAVLVVIGTAASSVFLAALVAPFTDSWADPDTRIAVYLLALLTAWAAGSLVAGPRRRRTTPSAPR